MNELKNNLSEINRLCSLHKVKSLFAFGSVINNELALDSDIDLLVDIESNDPLDYSENYFAVKFSLENILNRQIDLLEEKSISNPILRKNIESTKVLVYGR